MNSEIITLTDSTSKSESLKSWITSLTEYFTNKGFTVAEGSDFGLVNNEMVFGIQVTDDMGIAIYTTMWSNTHSKICLGTYTIVDGAVTINLIVEGGPTPIASSGSHVLNVNYHKDNNNTYLDIQLAENTTVFAGYLITPLTDFEITDISDTCLMVMNSSGYIQSMITPNRIYTASTTIIVSPLDFTLANDRYTCYSCPIMVHDTTLRGVLPNVKGIKGNFTHAFTQEIILEGKQYYYLGNNIYLPL